jgi:hypothetical protein
MTRTQALAKHLLAGKPVSIKTAYKDFGISNISREVARLIERPFGVTLTRTKKEGKTKYGSYCSWLEYSLMPSKINASGIKKLKKLSLESQKKQKVS